MPFRIRRVETRIVNLAIRTERVVVSTAGRHDTSRFVHVTVHADDGLRGFGEAATVPLWSGESAQTAQWMIEHVLAPCVIDATFDHPREALARMDAAAYANGFAKSALDTAAWDLWARGQGRSVASLIDDRPADPARGSTPPRGLPTRASIAAGSVANTVRLAETFWRLGVRTLKFKIGMPADDDVARLRAVRDALGPEPLFTVDANGGYGDAETAIRKLTELLPFDLAVIEQPTPRDRLFALAQVRRALPVPILVDEAVFTPGDLNNALDMDAFDIVGLYPGKNGGFTHAVDMARTAHAAGKRCAVGSNLESDLGLAAMATMAASLRGFDTERLAGDYASSLYYTEPSTRPAVELRAGRPDPPRALDLALSRWRERNWVATPGPPGPQAPGPGGCGGDSMGDKPVYRVALVGCGAIAETGHVPSLLAHERFKLVAVCDVRAERAQLLARQAGNVEASTDYRALLDRRDIQAVVLAMHPQVSVGAAIAFLERGLAVLDEKPLAVTLEDGRRLAAAVSHAKGAYQIGFVMRYCQVIRRLALLAREIGTPAVYRVGIYDERLDPGNPGHFDYIQRFLRESSAINHEGSHVLDYAGLWNDSGYTWAQAAAVRTEAHMDGPNLWSAQLGLGDGSVLHVSIGWLLPELPPSMVEMAGPRGSLYMNLSDGRGWHRHDGGQQQLDVQPLCQEWRGQLDAFAAAIDTGRPHGATVEDGLRALAASKACEQAWAMRTVVNVER